VNPACTADQYVNPAANAPDISKNTNQCCLNKATCADAGCSTRKLGLKQKASANAIKCPTDGASCDTSVCCEDDPTTCGVGNKNKACTAAQYINPAANTPDVQHATGQCCLAKADCNGAGCATKGKGLMTLATAGATKCPSNAASCSEGTCCVNNPATCGANGVNHNCAATEVFRPGQEDQAKGANCCMNKMTCLALKTTITCVAGGVYDSTKDLTVATADNKNYVCCEPKATCQALACAGTTTLKENRCSADVSKCKQEHCCKDDVTSCKNSGTTACKVADTFKDATKDNVKWLNPPGSTDPTVTCCSPVARCNSAGCATRKKGLKLIAAQAATKCTGGPSTCSETTCCEDDTTKCGVGNKNVNPACTADQYVNPAANAPDISKNTNQCCLNKATCADAGCSTRKLGLKQKASANAIKCPTDGASCDTSVCCEDDPTTCGVGNKNKACTAAQYINPAANTPDVQHATGQCCLAKADCNGAGCATKGKGLMTLATAGATKCPSNAASCSEGTCCVNNPATCGANGVNHNCAATEVFRPGQEDQAKGANCCMNKMTCLALKTTITCITGWTEYDSTKDLTVVTASAKNTACCKPVAAWNKCPAPETKTPGTSGGSTGGSGSGGSGTVGSPSGFDQLKPLACWRVALFVITMVFFRG